MTQDELKKLLNYNPDTGVFTWLNKPSSRSNRVKIGGVAGFAHNGGYWEIGVKGKRYLAHRLAYFYMTGELPGAVDHIDHNKRNNKWSNLRKATHEINGRNQSLRNTNTSGYMGVTWSKRIKKWFAQIEIDGKCIGLGHFADIKDAAAARKQADIKYGFHENHGEAR